ncbi:MAG: putative DNA-binding domain-containing protein [Pseudomonas sp.]|uniref:HvfC family RiPP maturation protein n=1 Tax=Pseudomonas sp. TaxID=306 RepID=UPI0033944E2F
MSPAELQQAFAGRIRDAQGAPRLPGIDASRMALYESLFFNNLEGLLASGFPVVRRVLKPARWRRLVRAFLRDARCHTPYFLEVGQAFVCWLQQGSGTAPGDPPFLLELAHYEWVELALDVAETELPASGSPADPLRSPMQWSPLAWPLSYAWPVQMIGAQYQPREVPLAPTCLLVWRDRGQRVRFMQLAPFACQLAVRLQTGTDPDALAALHRLAEASDLSADAAYVEHARGLLLDWQRHDILL